MREIVFKLVVDTDSTHGKLQRVEESLDELKAKGEKGSYYTFTTDANGKLRAVMHDLDEVQKEVETPKEMKVSADQALATIRDVKIAVDGVLQVVGGLVRSMNGLLDASLSQRQAMTLASVAFGEAATEMANFASAMQQVTNFEDDQLLSLMSKLSQTFKLNKDEIQQLVPVLLDFTEANKATGMSVESAFDLMGRALNGHTEMLGRYGIELDDTRLKTEGVSYLVEKLGEDYGGTAEALADLRLQNANAWGDIQETVGDMLTVLINPLLSGLRWLMDAYQSLSPVMQGFVAGIVIAIPLIGTITTAITALTAAYHALRVAMNPVAGIIGVAVGALSALGLGLAAASVRTDAVTTAQKSMNDEIKDCGKQVSVEAEKFSLLANRLLELRSQTTLANADKTEMKNIIRSLNDNYSEYIGNINLETSSYNNLATALRNASDALVQKQIAEVYGERYNAQIRKVAELQIEIDSQRAEVDQVRARRQQLMNSVDWDFLTSDRNAMGFNPASYFGNDGEWLKLERRLNQFGALTGQLQAAKNDLQQIGQAYRQAMLDAPDLTFTPASGAGSGSNTSGNDYDERQRKLEQLAQLQQRYDTLAIDDLVARKQKELEIERDAELAKAKSLGASEELIQGIRDHFAKESIRVEQDAADARLKALEAEEEARQKAIEDEARHQQELYDLRFYFDQQALDLAGRTWEAQLRAVDEYYAKRKDKLLAAGLTEEQIAEQSEQAKARIKDQYEERSLQGLSRTFGDLAKASEVFGKKGFMNWKQMSMAQAMVDTYASANAAYKAMAGIPVVGPGLAIAAAAAAVGAGLANVAAIMNTAPPKAATGGLLVGNSHSNGGILIEAEGDEYITAKDRVRALGKGLFDFLNFAPLEQVKKAFSGFTAPNIPIPESVSYAYAGGGSVGGNGLMSIMEAINDKMGILVEKNVQFDIHIDPLANDPVKVSEIADTGKRIRSEF